MVRIEKLIEKLMKLEKSSNKDKIYSTVIDIKQEIETTYNLDFSLNKQLESVENDCKAKGIKIPKSQFDEIKRSLKKYEKKSKNHAHYIACTMYLDGCNFNKDDELLLYIAKHGKDDKEEEKEEVNVPAQLVFGVTMSLVGFFMMKIPIPTCKDWGSRLVASGIVVCGNAISGKIEEDKKNEKGKK